MLREHRAGAAHLGLTRSFVQVRADFPSWRLRGYRALAGRATRGRSTALAPYEKTGQLAAVGHQDKGSRGGPLDRLPKRIYDLDACNAAVAGEVFGIEPLDAVHQA